jgi:hypothetical protein
MASLGERGRQLMISHKIVAAQCSPDRDVSADRGHQGPMSLQNPCNFGSYELHPKKLVQLIGCRDLNARDQKIQIAFPLE